MSRAAVSKSRADKGKPPAAQTPIITHEIVPGKFNDNDWNVMLDKDASEDYILDMVDEIVENTMDTIFKKYIDTQLLPYTISQARDAIIQIINWQYLSRDDGEVNTETDPSWQADEEPDPAVTDCWAQGSVPKAYLPPPTPVIVEETEEEVKQEAEVADVGRGDLSLEEEEPELPDRVSEPDDDVIQEQTEPETESSEEVVVEKKKKKFKFKPYRGAVKSAGVSRMTESVDDREFKLHMDEMSASLPSTDDRTSGMINMPASCHSILRSSTDGQSQVQAGRPPGSKDVVYDDMGNVIAVVRLDPERLPNHRVRVKYQVVDPATEAAQARLEAMRRGKSVSNIHSIRRLKTKTSTIEASPTSKSLQSSKSSHQPTIAPLPPPLIEAMEVTAGVTIKEGGRVRKGPNRYVRKTDVLEEHQKSLRPVMSRIPVQTLDVSDLLDRTTPVLRPMGESPPLPPIIPTPPPQSRISTM